MEGESCYQVKIGTVRFPLFLKCYHRYKNCFYQEYSGSCDNGKQSSRYQITNNGYYQQHAILEQTSQV